MADRKLHFCPACGFEYGESNVYKSGSLPRMTGTHRCPSCGFHFRVDEELNLTPLDKLENVENENKIEGQWYP